MGLCNSTLTPEERSERARSKKIDQEFNKLKLEAHRSRKVLLLGTGESGKSTLFRQSKMLYGQGFDSNDLEQFKMIITSNIIDGMRTLVEFTPRDKFGGLEEKALDFFSREDAMSYPERVTPEMAQYVKILWKHPAIQHSFTNRSTLKIAVQDNVRFFFDKIDVIQNPRYLPTKEDILHLRVATTGVVELQLSYLEQTIILLDVGGQRNERKKWIHSFDRCQAILFVAAISEFDQVIYEDGETNRLQEALDLFGEICNLPFFTRTHLMIFFNKQDLLEEKIKMGLDPRVLCPKLFADYTGALDYNEIVNYIIDLFAQRNAVPERAVYCHVTCATDTSNIQHVFEMVYDILLRDALDGVM